MHDPALRITDPSAPPAPSQLEAWLGKKAHSFWRQFVNWIDQAYPQVFTPQWLYGGQKHGWCLRFKKSKSFCSLVPEKGRFMLLIVFGAKERDAVETIRHHLSAPVSRAYDDATTYHDGKWLLLNIASKPAFADAQTLLTLKRKPKGDVASREPKHTPGS